MHVTPGAADLKINQLEFLSAAEDEQHCRDYSALPVVLVAIRGVFSP